MKSFKLLVLIQDFKLYILQRSLSLCSRSNPNEGGRPAISAYWADYTQVQMGAMMATVPHCHRQPIFIEQSEAILEGLEKQPTCQLGDIFLSTRPQGLHLMHKAGLSTRHQGAAFFVQWIHQLIRSQHAYPQLFLRPWVKVRPEKNP